MVRVWTRGAILAHSVLAENARVRSKSPTHANRTRAFSTAEAIIVVPALYLLSATHYASDMPYEDDRSASCRSFTLRYPVGSHSIRFGAARPQSEPLPCTRPLDELAMLQWSMGETEDYV
jgi:hypothetical protein